MNKQADIKRKKNVGLTRATADRLIAEMIGRAKRINRCNAEYLYRVVRMEVFGSYLSDKDRLGDLDVAVLTEPRVPLGSEEYYRRSKREEQMAPSWANIVVIVYWPVFRIAKELKSGSRGISIHDMSDLNELKALHGTESRVIFEKSLQAVCRL